MGETEAKEHIVEEALKRRKMKLVMLFALLGIAFADPTVYFKEEFGDDWEDRWVVSKHRSDLGEFVQSAGKFYGDAEKDKFSNKDKNLLVKKDIRCKDDVFTHLYTLIVKSDGSYEVLIDNESAQKGTLEDDWDFLPPKMIKDPEAKKPEDWDERAKIDDAEDTKPEDYDQPEHIADPDATKPEDWDDEMDGEWEPPMIDNPDYKGEWKPRQIDNPDYKGKWVHPEIDNPEYNPDDAKDIGKYAENCKIGFDLWQVKSGTIFDNMMITDDPAEAKAAGEALWAVTKEAEKKMKDAQDEEERAKAEAEAGEKGDDEDDEDLDDLDEDEEDEVKDGDDEDAEGHDEL